MPVVIAGLILSFLVMLLFGGTEIDRGLLLLFSGADTPRLDAAARLLGLGAGPTPLVLLLLAGAGILFFRENWRAALLLLAVALVGRLLVDGLQAATEGLRPSVDERLLPRQQSLYPSGRAANATITGFALAFLLTRNYPQRALALSLAAFLALLVGAAQLLEGAAWPSDVIGGWGFGLAWVLLALRLAREDLSDGAARATGRASPSDSPEHHA